MNNTAKLRLIKHVLYALLMLTLYVLQTLPGLFVIYGVKPILVVSAAVSIAMFEGEFTGGIYGAAAGLLCDMGGFSLFGFNGFFICVFCVTSGLLVLHLMRCNLLSCILFVFVTTLVRGSIEYLFAFGMWRYDNVSMVYLHDTLPTVIYSTAAAIPVYGIFYSVRRRILFFEEKSL